MLTSCSTLFTLSSNITFLFLYSLFVVSSLLNEMKSTSRYIQRIAIVSSGAVDDNTSFSKREVVDWMHKIQEWNPNIFTLSHVPAKYRLHISKFIRRVIIARMAESPDLANAYHQKLKEAYETEDMLKNPDLVKRSRQQLCALLDEAEAQLKETTYLAGEEFSPADIMLIPLLARLVLLDLGPDYIHCRPKLAQYWSLVRQRPSYNKVIGKYFDGWRKHKTLMKTWCFVRIRSMLRRY